MIEKIIDFSARNKFIVIFFAAVAILASIWAMKNVPLDALPDLSDTQVIIYSTYDQSPNVIEDQVTYPIVSALVGAPGVRSVRGFSDYGFSYVYVIFEDGTDIYWARSRVMEYLATVQSSLPDEVSTELGPDASGVGWIYQYALVDETGNHDLHELRSYQDWTLRFRLQSVEGVAEVASIGGYVKQYQININPNYLLAYNIPITDVINAVRDSNQETGGRVLEFGGREYMIRGKGYIENIQDIKDTVVGVDSRTGNPVLIRHVADVEIGPEMRRGVADLNGRGDVVGGIVVMRHGENALNVINRVKERIDDISPYLPEGMEIVPVYDRSDLIQRSIDTLKKTLTYEMILVSIIVMLFLWHFPSATTIIITLPVSVILAFLPMYFLGVTSNIMSLAGIAIAIGVLVDGTIVQVENMYRRVQIWMAKGGEESTGQTFEEVRINALKEVAPSIFFSLMVLAVAFLPVFTLVETEGRLFTPLAYTKTFAMGIAAILAVTLDPAVRMLYTRYKFYDFRPRWLAAIVNTVYIGKYYREEHHPVTRLLYKIYEPACRFTIKHRYKTVAAAIILVIGTIPVYRSLGSEFMPPLNEGSILYMPTTLPGISVGEAQRILQIQDRIFKSFPEVESVFGKAGRAETSTDPAPFSMIETTVVLKPESEWRVKERWYSWLPDFIHPVFRPIWRDRITWDELVEEMNSRMQFPGWTNSYTMPIRARIDMLSTGIRTPIGIKIYGDDLNEIEDIGEHIEHYLRQIEGARSVYAERVTGGYFIDFDLRRDQLARYGLSVNDALTIINSAIGGANVTTTIEGRERFPVNVRYDRRYRDSIQDLRRVLVPLENGTQIPISQIADIQIRTGPGMIRNEDGMRAGYVFVDVEGRDIGSFVQEARETLNENLMIPTGYSLEWSGQYENMQRVSERLTFVVPLTIFLIFLLIYMNTRSTFRALLILLTLPFSLIGAVWLLYLLDYNISIAVWVGMIALLGLDAETSIFMLLFLDLSYDDWKKEGRLNTKEDLIECAVEGAVKRIRPKMMTVMTAFFALLPILWSMGTGADLMKRIAAPMVGGILTSFILELLIYPVIYVIWREKQMDRERT